MKMLITGSSGRVGRAIYVRLYAEHHVVGFDRTPSSAPNIISDLTDSQALQKALHGMDAVVHTAALHAPNVGYASDAEFERVNVDATQNLLELALRAGVKQLIFTITTALYGAASTPDDQAGWVDEALAPQPKTIYHRSKIAAENLLADFSKLHDFKVTVLRMSRCFPEPAPQMACFRLHRGIDARDVADAHAHALASKSTGFSRYVISGVTPFQPEDTHALLHNPADVLQRRAPELVSEFAKRHWPLPKSIDRVYASELGWRARYGFTEVLEMLDERSSEVLPVRLVA